MRWNGSLRSVGETIGVASTGNPGYQTGRRKGSIPGTWHGTGPNDRGLPIAVNALSELLDVTESLELLQMLWRNIDFLCRLFFDRLENPGLNLLISFEELHREEEL